MFSRITHIYSICQYFISFYCPVRFSLYGCITFWLTIHHFKDIWFVSTFLLLWIMLLLIIIYKFFFFPEDVYFHFSCIYTWVALLNHMKFYVYLFKEEPNSLSKHLDYFILLTKMYECPNRSHLCQHLGGRI